MNEKNKIFCILNNIIGSEKHLYFNGENYYWIDEIPAQTWIFGQDKEDINEHNLSLAFYLCGNDVSINIDKNYYKTIDIFTKRCNLPWQKLMPKWKYDNFIKETIEQIIDQIGKTDFKYWEIFNRNQKTLELLQPAKINKKVFKYLTNNNIFGVNNEVIYSFQYDEHGFAKKVEYSLISTRSGRLTVLKGPRILTLNKEYKCLISSRYKNGQVWQFDYQSLEPRFALYIVGKNINGDIYNHFNDYLFGNKFNRNELKQFVLSIVYGSGAETISKLTNISLEECNNIILKLKQYFNVFQITRKLIEEYKQYGYIKNYYGRIIRFEQKEPPGYLLYNQYIQSSAIDIALLGFENIIKLNKGIPLYIIQDNIIIDLENESYIQDIVNAGSKNIFGIDIEMTMSPDKII